MAAAWAGGISCAVHVPSEPEAAAAAIQAIDNMYAAACEQPGFADRISLTLCQEPFPRAAAGDDGASWASPLYPINVLRNAALRAAKTDLVFLLDVDFVPSEGAHSALQALARAHVLDRQALVVPAVELPGAEGAEGELPQSKGEVAQLLRAGKAEGFHVTRYPRGHQATDFDRWLAESEGGVYPVEYEEGFEPYVVCRRLEVPAYDERFRGYGLNKVAHLRRMAIVDGFEFLVASSAFVSAREHQGSPDWLRTFGPSRDHINVQRLQALWDVAIAEMARDAAA